MTDSILDSRPESRTVHTIDHVRWRTVTTEKATVVEISPDPARNTPALATVPVSETDLDDVLAGMVIRRIVALDVLEHVLDEEAWIATAARLLEPGGTFVIRMPLEGPLAWLDALNLYRYVQDTVGTGKDLLETKLKGWHRHYRVGEVLELLRAAGFDIVSVKRSGSRAVDAAQFGALLWGGMVRHDTRVEHRTRAWRDAMEAEDDLPRRGAFSSKVTVTAVRRPA